MYKPNNNLNLTQNSLKADTFVLFSWICALTGNLTLNTYFIELLEIDVSYKIRKIQF